MRIQHNIAAMNSYRNYSNNTSGLSKNLEKLSSGYKINRAGDDAAGLAISEKMRAQITGLEVAQKNAKDGISVVQTAEGALTEVHDMLNRMYSLAEQSANGTYSITEREKLQAEIDQLTDEIDRIADSTNFNGMKLLNGDMASGGKAVNTATQLMTIKGGAVDSSSYEKATGDKWTINFADSTKAIESSSSNKYAGVKVAFTSAEGKDYTLTLVSDEQGGAMKAADLKALLEGSGNATSKSLVHLVDANGEDQNEALEAFRSTFTFAVTKNGSGADLSLTLSDPDSKGELKSFATQKNAKAEELMTASYDTLDAKKSEGMDAGYQVKLKYAGDGAPNKDNGQFQIGDKKYQLVAAGKTAADGYKAITLPNTAASTAQTVDTKNANLKAIQKALAEDGFTAQFDSSGAKGDYTIRFTKLDEISQAQNGAEIKDASDVFAIENQEAAKQSSTMKFAHTGSAVSQTLTVRYTDANGEAQTKQIAYKDANTSATAGVVAKAAADALAGDTDFGALFKATAKGDTLTIEAKNKGDSIGQLVSIYSDDTAELTSNVTIGAGQATGKTLGLKDGETIEKGAVVTVNGKTYEFAEDNTSPIGDGNIRVLVGTDKTESLKNLSQKLTENGIKNDFSAKQNKIIFNDTENAYTTSTASGGGLMLQIGDTADDFNKLTVSIDDMHAASLFGGEDGRLNIVDDNNSVAQAKSQAVMDTINQAIDKVSTVRGNLGAIQNRLEHTINNLSVTRENLQDAESTIRDTDVAEEMMAYTKNSILNQAAQAMLAQANQMPQGVLQLLG